VPPSAGKSRTPVLTFNSFAFALFFLVVLGCYQLPLSWRAKKGILLGSSYLFYAAWNPPFVGLLVVSTVVDWVAGKRIHTSRGTTRKAWLVLSLCTNLGILSYFKYSPFLLESFSELAAGAGIVFEPATAGIVLPIGISFYTFQTLSYSIDIYRRKLSPSTSFLDYALFVTFFPQLVAGPIVRASEFLPQCLEPKRTDARQLGWGLILLTLGLFQKTILADQVFAPIADLIYGEPTTVSFATAWLGTLAFSGQIFLRHRRRPLSRLRATR
jgi:alginate O-acetyltransferase complex protein AlgI